VAVDSDKVFFGLGSRNVTAISRETAKEVWTFRNQSRGWAKPLYIPANPDDATSRAMVYVVSLDHYLYALDAETGHLLWKKDLGGAAPGRVFYDEQRHWVYVGTFLSEMLAVDLSSREIVYRFKADNWIWGGPVLENDVLYFGDLDGNLYAVRIHRLRFRAGMERIALQRSDSRHALVNRGYGESSVRRISMCTRSTKRWCPNRVEKDQGRSVVEYSAGSRDDTTPELVVVGTTETDRLVVAYPNQCIEAWDEIWH